MSYHIEIKKTAQKEIKKIPNPAYKKIITEISLLADDPRPPGCKKLRGTQNVYRIRIGTYRVIYTIQDNILLIEVIKIGHRKNIYL